MTTINQHEFLPIGKTDAGDKLLWCNWCGCVEIWIGGSFEERRWYPMLGALIQAHPHVLQPTVDAPKCRRRREG